jgi:hypothetical protein
VSCAGGYGGETVTDAEFDGEDLFRGFELEDREREERMILRWFIDRQVVWMSGRFN